MTPPSPRLESSWLAVLADEFTKPYMKSLRSFLVEEKKKHIVYPKGSEFFAAFAHTPLPDVRVLILGQDPYHGPGQAHGLSFSVRHGVRVPPSLQNIHKELHDDLNLAIPTHGNLESWAKKGVLLLNSVLSVRKGNAASHSNKGWEQFTDAAIRALSTNRSNVVFILWGRKAREKSKLIDLKKHHIITSSHPSPYSADYGFFGSKPFSRCNEYFQKHHLPLMDWSL